VAFSAPTLGEIHGARVNGGGGIRRRASPAAGARRRRSTAAGASPFRSRMCASAHSSLRPERQLGYSLRAQRHMERSPAGHRAPCRRLSATAGVEHPAGRHSLTKWTSVARQPHIIDKWNRIRLDSVEGLCPRQRWISSPGAGRSGVDCSPRPQICKIRRPSADPLEGYFSK
jgi:hypothetical protein